MQPKHRATAGRLGSRDTVADRVRLIGSLVVLTALALGCSAPEQQLADHVTEIGALYADETVRLEDRVARVHAYLGEHIDTMEAVSGTLRAEIENAQSPAQRAQEANDVLAQPVVTMRQARRAFRMTAIRSEAVHVTLRDLGAKVVAERSTRMQEAIASVMRAIRRAARKARPTPP